MKGCTWNRAAVMALALLFVVSGFAMSAGHPMLRTSPGPTPTSTSGSFTAIVPSNAPLSASLSVNPNHLSKGQSIEVQTNVNGGTPPYSYSYSGLPGGCPGQNAASYSCTPSAAGNFNVNVEVTDNGGNHTSSNSVGVDVSSSSNGNGGGSGNNSSNPLSSLLSGFGGFLSIVLVFGIVGFVTWILLVVGVWIIAVVLYRRLPKRATDAPPSSAAKCTACGAVLPAGSKFCSECGRSTAPKAS